MAYNVYSLPDVKSVLYHPDVGTANLHLCGIGKITVAAAGDLSSHTATADGYVVVNRLKTTNGTIQIEVPQNSIGDDFLRRWARWAKAARLFSGMKKKPRSYCRCCSSSIISSTEHSVYCSRSPSG